MRRLRALVVLILIGEAAAVEVGKPSKTSISAAARRALAARDYDPTVRNPDWVAELFLGPAERKLLAGDQAIKDLERDYREAIKEQPPALGMAHIRTRFTDERLHHAVRGGAAQVVILGAGYDSRAYRMRVLKNVMSDCLKSIMGQPRNTRNSACRRFSGACLRMLHMSRLTSHGRNLAMCSSWQDIARIE